MKTQKLPRLKELVPLNIRERGKYDPSTDPALYNLTLYHLACKGIFNMPYEPIRAFVLIKQNGKVEMKDNVQ